MGSLEIMDLLKGEEEFQPDYEEEIWYGEDQDTSGKNESNEQTDQTSQENNVAANFILDKRQGKSKARQCPVCKERIPHVKRHVIRKLIPWYVSPHMACWGCGEQLMQTGKITGQIGRAHV